jgi:murein DD-endopeptidase MepM/ murein hydrolase activator NlpD
MGSIIPGLGNVLMALWSVIDVIMLVVMFWPQITEGAQKAFSAIGDFWNEKIWPIIESVKGFFTGIIDWIKEKFDLKTVLMTIIAPIPTLIFNVFPTIFEKLKNLFSGVVNWIKEKFNLSSILSTIFGPIPNLFGSLIKKIFEALPSGIKGPILSAYNWVAGKLNTALGWLSNIPLIPDIPKLPIITYAEGGLVGGVYRGGDSVPALLTPGEYVLTRGMVQQAGVGNLEQWRAGSRPSTNSAPNNVSAPVRITAELGRMMMRAFLPLFKKVVDMNRGVPIYGALLLKVYNWLKEKDKWLSGVTGGPPPPSRSGSGAARDAGVQYFAHGGPVRGRYRGTDTVRAMVTPGEYVLPRFVVQRLGLKRLEDMRRGMFYPMGGSLLQDIPLAENWVQKELERLLKYFREQEKYKYLKISSNEDAFREKLSAALTLQLEGKKKAYDLAQQQLNMRQVQEKAMTAFRIPEWANEREIYDLVPPAYLETELSQVYRGPAVTSLTELLRQKTDLEVADAKEVATRLILNEQVEQELFAEYLKYLAQKAAEELAAAAAAQQPPSEAPAPPPGGGGSYQAPPPPEYTSGQDDSIRILWGAKHGNADPATRQPWHYPLTKYYKGSTWNEHRPIWAIDFAAVSGIDVLATQYGKVVEVGDRGSKSYGKYLYIDHHDNLRSVYAHLREIDHRIKKGRVLLSGSYLGKSGYSGGVRPPGKGGAHLHFELWRPRGSNGKGSTYYNLTAKGVKIDKPRGLAEGGIVAATAGGIPAILAEGGRDERVTPLDSKGRSTTEVEMLRLMETLSEREGGFVVHNHIYPAQGMSERELAVKVSREITYQQRRRS